jgi:predicted ATPase/class 3 adenylate cyclase
MNSNQLPRGIITFLFTDIEGSTQLLQAIGPRYGDVLGEHHRLMREAVAKHEGIEISTEGDAFFVAFTSPADAIMAATAAQRAFTKYAYQEGLDLRIRMGLHTGEGRIVGDNYGGIDVHRAARISSAAHGGQVLISATTRALAEPLFGEEIRLKDLGEHRLKDLDRPEHLYQLCIDGLRSEFPPLRTLGSRPNNLPVVLTTFVERDREAAEIRSLLESSRLITLTGPGGTGKTRLSLQIGSEVLTDFEDGVFVVRLAAVDDPDLVPSTIAESLGLKEQGLRPIADIVKAYLADKRMFLLLDNFEQVIDAAPFVAELLVSSPRLNVMVTSRAALRISGEQEYPVPPMTLPHPERLPSLEALKGSEAVALFSQRARSVKPDFEITERNAEAVSEICWRLDGLPLAIELAAARVRLLSPEQILEKLRGGLALLSGGARDLPARQQTLRNAIAWSYDMLDEPLRAFFKRLSVFVGSWTFESADAICNPDGELQIDTLEGLEVLTEVNLVRLLETDDGETRFRMLQTIREFALEVFRATEDSDSISRRHAQFFLDLIDEFAPRLTAEIEVIRTVELEHDNMRAALRWALDHAEVEHGLRMGASLWRFWMLRSHLAEGRKWLTELLAMPGAAGNTAHRAHAVMALGSVTYWQNDFDSTRDNYLEALEIFSELGDRPGMMDAFYNAGFISLIHNDAGGARGFYEKSRELAAELRDEQGLANAAWGLAMCAVRDRDFEAAADFGNEALERHTRLGNTFGASLAQFVFFQIARFKGDRLRAHRMLLGFQNEADVLGDISSTQGTLELLAGLELESGHYEDAVRLMGASEMLRERYGGGSPPPLIEVEDPRPTAREVLGETRTEELWEQGRTMSPEEATAYLRKLIENAEDETIGSS